MAGPTDPSMINRWKTLVTTRKKGIFLSRENSGAMDGSQEIGPHSSNFNKEKREKLLIHRSRNDSFGSAADRRSDGHLEKKKIVRQSYLLLINQRNRMAVKHLSVERS